MPAPSRAQRRRANLQKQVSGSRPSVSQQRQPQPESDTAFTGETIALDEQSRVEPTVEAPVMPAPSYGTRPARQTRQMRQGVARPAPTPPAPVDYSADYFHARRDLVRIFIWSALLFAAMIAIRLTGIL